METHALFFIAAIVAGAINAPATVAAYYFLTLYGPPELHIGGE